MKPPLNPWRLIGSVIEIAMIVGAVYVLWGIKPAAWVAMILGVASNIIRSSQDSA